MTARTRSILAAVFLFGVGGGFVVLQIGAGNEDRFDEGLYSTLQARTIDDVQGLIDAYLVERSTLLRILPPGDWEFVQPVAPIPAYLAELPDRVIEGLIGEEIAPTIVGYRVYLAEEATTSGSRRWLVMNAESEVLWSEWAPAAYDPFEKLALLHPDLVAAAEQGDPEAVAEWEALKQWNDPARLILAAHLIATDDLTDYVWAESLARNNDALSVQSGQGGGMIMSSGPYTSNDLWLAINGVTNGCTGTTADLTIHTPAGDTNSSYDVFYAPALGSPTDWQFLMRCPTNIIAQTNVFARYLCEDQGYFGLMEVATNCDLIVTTNVTPQEMAELLVPPWVTVTNATYTGAVMGRGVFSNGNCCGLPIENGLILSSGPITNAVGPNDDSGSIAYSNGSGGLGYPGNTNLDDLVGGTESYDAAVLAFDIISTNSLVLQFQYVFTSEEYPEYSGSQYNDPMAIFISTNRVGEQWMINPTNNVALVPCTTNVAVTVNKVHGGCTNDYLGNYVFPTNAFYYVDNHDPDYSAVPPYAAGDPAFDIEYDGMTILLSADVWIPSEVTNHVMIGVEDYTDEHYDSAVFLKAWSPNGCP